MKQAGSALGSAYQAFARSRRGGVLGGEGDFFLVVFSSTWRVLFKMAVAVFLLFLLYSSSMICCCVFIRAGCGNEIGGYGRQGDLRAPKFRHPQQL